MGTIWLASLIPTADWYATFYPAGLAVLHGRSPYEVPGWIPPPWGILFVIPFVLFPAPLSRGLVLVASALAILYTAWRLRPNLVAVVALFLSPTVIGTLLAGNQDAFVQLGVFLPPMWGLLVLMIKPQIGFGVAVYYLIVIWRDNPGKRVIRVAQTFAPVVVGYVLTPLIFPIWIERMTSRPDIIWNRSIFPYGIPIGIFFLYLAIRRHNVFFAMASSVFFSPYLTFYTYIVVQLALLHQDVEKVIRRDLLQIILCIFLWVIMLIYKL